MKRSLYLKFVLVFLAFAVLTLILVTTLGTWMDKSSRLDIIEDQMYTEANYLATTYRSALKDGSNLQDDKTLLAAVAMEKSRDLAVLVLNKSYEVLYPESGHKMTDFDPTACDNHHGFVSTLSGLYPEEQLCVYSPVAGDFSTSAYIILTYPMSLVNRQTEESIKVLYLVALFIFVLSLSLFVFLHFLVLKPIRQITRAASEYAAGNLTYTYKYHSNDELGVLSERQTYMASALAQTAEDQRKFITNVSHDFRSPLTSIRGYLDAILDGTIPPELHEKYIRIVKDETDRLTSLTQNILDLNTLGQGGVLLDYRDFDIHHEIKKILATFEGRCTDKRISFELTFLSHDYYVHADLGRIQQVLYNLIDNAIKFSSPGSTIFIETAEKHNKAYISIKDQGVGIPADSLKKIWERFYKTDPSRGRDKKGSGLGLSITKEIILAHGETIDVISTEGVGTEFIFTLEPGEKPATTT